jgi:AraC-like DNA-binding protein
MQELGNLKAARHDVDRTLVRTVRQVISDGFALGYPHIARSAEHLGVSVRSLQRNLARAHVSYSELVDDLRRELALVRVAGRDDSISRIASELGFGDPGSFTRAFRRWTGTSPRSYRDTRTP